MKRLSASATLLLIAITLTLTSCNHHTRNDGPRRFHYASLRITTLRAPGGLENYSWMNPSSAGDAASAFRTDSKGMGEYFGLNKAQCKRDAILNHISEMGWQLVSVHRQPSYSMNGALTPDYVHYHFILEKP